MKTLLLALALCIAMPGQVTKKYDLLFGNKKLLLDTYPSAAAAYSLRKLRSQYTGSAIRVRRSSDNAESDIGFIAGVLDTATLKTFVGAGNGLVTTWYDQSANNKNLVQITASAQPIIVSSGIINRVDGLPAINAGSSPTTRFLYDSTYTLSQPITLAMVGKTPNDLDQMVVSSINTTMRVYRRYLTSNNFFLQAGNSVTVNVETFNNTLEFVVFNGASSSFFLNGIVQNSGDYGTNGINGITFFKGTPGFVAFDATLQEVIIWNTSQVNNRTQITNMLNSFYRIY